MIWYDNLRMFKSVSYYVQQMYAMNKGTHVLQLTTADPNNAKKQVPVAGQNGMDGLFASSVLDNAVGEVVIKVVNTSSQPQAVSINLHGMKGERTAQTLTEPEKIVPKAGTLQCGVGAKQLTVLTDNVPAMAFRLYRVKK